MVVRVVKVFKVVRVFKVIRVIKVVKDVRDLKLLKDLSGEDAEGVEDVGQRLGEGRLELHRQQHRLATKRTRECPRLVLVPGLAVGKYKDFIYVSDIRNSAPDNLLTITY